MKAINPKIAPVANPTGSTYSNEMGKLNTKRNLISRYNNPVIAAQKIYKPYKNFDPNLNSIFFDNL